MPERVLVSLWFSPPFIVRPLSPQTLSLLDPQTNSLCDGGIVLVAQMIKDLLAVQETGVQSLGGEDPQRGEWQPTPVFLPEEFHGLRSLAGYSPWGHKESDTTEQLSAPQEWLRESQVTVCRGSRPGPGRNAPPQSSSSWS